MTFKTLTGKTVSKNCHKYRIDWDKEERSKIQTKVKKFLQPYWKNYIVFAEFPVFGTKLKIDIFNASKLIGIEIDGQQHTKYVEHFVGNRVGYLNLIKRDVKKEEWCEVNEINLLRINYDEVDLLSHSWFKERFGISL